MGLLSLTKPSFHTLVLLLMTDLLTLTQVLCTRLCHDLAGPIGAVAAGVELVGNDPAQVDAEMLQLIANSSTAASRKLKFLRTALGTPGVVSLTDFQAMVGGYFEATAGSAGKVAITWPTDVEFNGLAQRLEGHTAQLLANLLLMAIEVVPRVRQVAIAVHGGEAFKVTIDALGDVSSQHDPRQALLAVLANPSGAALTPKSVQPIYTHLIVSNEGGSLTAQLSANGCCVVAAFPASG
jgi:histidine phosphotransferase ChpT